MAIGDLDETATQPAGKVDVLLSREAAEMVSNALHYCEGKTAYRGADQLAAALRAEIPQVHDYFRHALTTSLANYLIRLDDSVIEVYSYCYGDAEEEGEDRSCRVTGSLNLILHVRRRTAALSSVEVSLDQALLEQYKRLIAPNGDRMTSFLDLQMVDDRDVAEGLGFGAVLKSTFSRPVRVWPE